MKARTGVGVPARVAGGVLLLAGSVFFLTRATGSAPIPYKVAWSSATPISATPKPSVLTPKVEDFPVGASPYASGQLVRQIPIRPITGRSPAALAASERLLTFDPKVPVTLDYRERQEAVSVLLALQDYDALDCVADTLRQKKLHGRGGDWLLHQFYEVLIEVECSGAEWLSKNKQSLAAHVVAGKYFVNQAWKSRGGGFAETVSEKGWKGFKENLERAQAVLLAGSKLGGDPALLVNALNDLIRTTAPVG